MRIRRWLAVAVLLALPAALLAQAVVQDGSSYRQNLQAQASGGIVRADSTMKILTVDASGNLVTTTSNPVFNNYRTGTLINNWLFASTGTMADSNTTPVQAYDLKRMGLFIYGIHDSLSTVVRIAVQVRGHTNQNTDSVSTYAWLRWTNAAGIPGGASAGVFRVDSIGQPGGFINIPTTAVQTTNATVAVASPYLLPGEFEVIFNVARRDTIDGTQGGKPFSAPLGYYVPLTGAMGEWFWAPYVTVRARVINGVRSRFRLRVEYAGTSL